MCFMHGMCVMIKMSKLRKEITFGDKTADK